jgi:hypothetical protein
MRLTMRGPILGIAFLLGPCFVVAMGALSACQITPTETMDAGTDVYIPPGSCDEVGLTCAQCQTCPGVQASCAVVINACETDPNGTCIGLAMCNDACDVNAPEDPNCKQECCTEFGANDPTGVELYVNTARCIYQEFCPQTCFLQASLDVCTGF